MKIDLKSSWLKSGFISLLDRGSVQILRFLSFFLMVRALSKADFGIWSLYLTLAAIVELIRVGLIQNALVRFLSIHTEKDLQAEISTASLTISLVQSIGSTVMLLGIGWVVTHFWNLAPLDKMLAIYVLSTFVMSLSHHFLAIQQAHLQFHGTFFANLARHSSLFAYVAFIYFSPHHTHDLVSIVWAQFGSILLGALVAVITGFRVARFSRHISFSRIRELVRYGKYIVGTYFSTSMIKTIDQVMLGAMVSPVGVASYSTAMRIAHLVEVPIQSIAAVVFPQSARRMKSQGPEAIRRIYEKSVGVILAMIIPGALFVALFAEWVLVFVAGPRYIDTVPILQLVMLYALLLPFSRQFGTIVESIGKPHYQFWLFAFGAALNIPLNYIMVRYFGVKGAAAATIGTYGLIVGASLIVLNREIGVRLSATIGFSLRLYRNGFMMIWNMLTGNRLAAEQKINSGGE